MLNDFQKHLGDTGEFPGETNFKEKVLSINKNEPTKEFAESYLKSAKDFLERARVFRNEKFVQPVA
jgi:sulfite reductase (ferredoxin)